VNVLLEYYSFTFKHFSNRQHAISCGVTEVLAEAIPKAYNDPKLLEEYCRCLKYLHHKGTVLFYLSDKNCQCHSYYTEESLKLIGGELHNYNKIDFIFS